MTKIQLSMSQNCTSRYNKMETYETKRGSILKGDITRKMWRRELKSDLWKEED